MAKKKSASGKTTGFNYDPKATTDEVKTLNEEGNAMPTEETTTEETTPEETTPVETTTPTEETTTEETPTEDAPVGEDAPVDATPVVEETTPVADVPVVEDAPVEQSDDEAQADDLLNQIAQTVNSTESSASDETHMFDNIVDKATTDTKATTEKKSTTKLETSSSSRREYNDVEKENLKFIAQTTLKERQGLDAIHNSDAAKIQHELRDKCNVVGFYNTNSSYVDFTVKASPVKDKAGNKLKDTSTYTVKLVQQKPSKCTGMSVLMSKGLKVAFENALTAFGKHLTKSSEIAPPVDINSIASKDLYEIETWSVAQAKNNIGLYFDGTIYQSPSLFQDFYKVSKSGGVSTTTLVTRSSVKEFGTAGAPAITVVGKQYYYKFEETESGKTRKVKINPLSFKSGDSLVAADNLNDLINRDIAKVGYRQIMTSNVSRTLFTADNVISARKVEEMPLADIVAFSKVTNRTSDQLDNAPMLSLAYFGTLYDKLKDSRNSMTNGQSPFFYTTGGKGINILTTDNTVTTDYIAYPFLNGASALTSKKDDTLKMFNFNDKGQLVVEHWSKVSPNGEKVLVPVTGIAKRRNSAKNDGKIKFAKVFANLSNDISASYSWASVSPVMKKSMTEAMHKAGVNRDFEYSDYVLNVNKTAPVKQQAKASSYLTSNFFVYSQYISKTVAPLFTEEDLDKVNSVTVG